MIVTGKRCVVAGWSVTLDTQMWQHIKRTNTTQPTDDMHYTAGETRATHNAHLVFRREVTHGGVTCNKITAWCVGDVEELQRTHRPRRRDLVCGGRGWY